MLYLIANDHTFLGTVNSAEEALSVTNRLNSNAVRDVWYYTPLEPLSAEEVDNVYTQQQRELDEMQGDDLPACHHDFDMYDEDWHD